jgi:hypothetical protein
MTWVAEAMTGYIELNSLHSHRIVLYQPVLLYLSEVEFLLLLIRSLICMCYRAEVVSTFELYCSNLDFGAIALVPLNS